MKSYFSKAIKSIKILFFCFLFFSILESPVNSHAKDLKDISDFNVYYGEEYNDYIKEEIKKLDMVIVEPTEFEDENRKLIKKDIQNSNTLVYGYLSATELSPWDDILTSLVTEDDYLVDNEGNPITNWGYNIIDLRKSNTRRILIDLIGLRIVQGGYDGLFLDSFDNYESSNLLGSSELVEEMTTSI